MTEQNLKAYQPRRYQRRSEELEVLICVKGQCGTVTTYDVSDGGLGLNLSTARDLPELKVGSIVSTRPVDSPHSSAIVARVVRIENNNMGIEFVS